MKINPIRKLDDLLVGDTYIDEELVRWVVVGHHPEDQRVVCAVPVFECDCQGCGAQLPSWCTQGMVLLALVTDDHGNDHVLVPTMPTFKAWQHHLDLVGLDRGRRFSAVQLGAICHLLGRRTLR